MSNDKIAYAVRMSDGHYVGIWNDRANAELVRSKQPAAHSDEVVEMVPASALAGARADTEAMRTVLELLHERLSAAQCMGDLPGCVDEMQAEAERLRADAEYYRWRLQEIIPLFQEARDALPAITLEAAKLRGLDLSLGDRMDAAGTRTREQFDAAVRGEK